MKTKCLRIGKRTLSVVLSFLMIVSTLVVGNLGSLEALSASTQSEYFSLRNSNSSKTMKKLSSGSDVSTATSYQSSCEMQFHSSDDSFDGYNYLSIMSENGAEFSFYKSTGDFYYSQSGNRAVTVDGSANTSMVKNNSTKTYTLSSTVTGEANYRIFFSKTNDGV